MKLIFFAVFAACACYVNGQHRFINSLRHLNNDADPNYPTESWTDDHNTIDDQIKSNEIKHEDEELGQDTLNVVNENSTSVHDDVKPEEKHTYKYWPQIVIIKPMENRPPIYGLGSLLPNANIFGPSYGKPGSNSTKNVKKTRPTTQAMHKTIRPSVTTTTFTSTTHHTFHTHRPEHKIDKGLPYPEAREHETSDEIAEEEHENEEANIEAEPETVTDPVLFETVTEAVLTESPLHELIPDSPYAEHSTESLSAEINTHHHPQHGTDSGTHHHHHHQQQHTTESPSVEHGVHHHEQHSTHHHQQHSTESSVVEHGSHHHEPHSTHHYQPHSTGHSTHHHPEHTIESADIDKDSSESSVVEHGSHHHEPHSTHHHQQHSAESAVAEDSTESSLVEHDTHHHEPHSTHHYQPHSTGHSTHHHPEHSTVAEDSAEAPFIEHGDHHHEQHSTDTGESIESSSAEHSPHHNHQHFIESPVHDVSSELQEHEHSTHHHQHHSTELPEHDHSTHHHDQQNTDEEIQRPKNPCTTPNGASGECISVYNCRVLLDLVNKKDRTSQEFDLLKKSQCGFEGKLPAVCCPKTTPPPPVPEGNCYTPEGNVGTCVSLYSCSHLANMLKPPVPSENIAYVQKSKCEGTEQYSVCCGPPPDRKNEIIVPSGNCNALMSSFPPDPRTECCGVDSRVGNKIVGGNATTVDQYPWLVMIEYVQGAMTKLLCGGVLISGKYVLTAGHCVAGQVLTIGTPKRVRLGEYDIAHEGPDCAAVEAGGEDCTEGVTRILIEKVIPHPQYNPVSPLKRNDIALLRLKEVAPFTDFIRPICLPNKDLTVPPNRPANFSLYAAGWGAVSERKSYSNVKLHVELPFVSPDKCQPVYSFPGRSVPLWKAQMCAGGVTGKDSCKGDSGGPLMFEDGRTYEVIGIVSFGPVPCGMEGVPGVYSKVYEYLGWIRSNIVP